MLEKFTLLENNYQNSIKILQDESKINKNDVKSINLRK